MCVRFTERARQRALCLFALSFARERERGCAGCVKREREREREKKERGSRSRKKSRDGNFFLSSLFVVDVDAGPPLRVFHAPEVHSRALPRSPRPLPRRPSSSTSKLLSLPRPRCYLIQRDPSKKKSADPGSNRGPKGYQFRLKPLPTPSRGAARNVFSNYSLSLFQLSYQRLRGGMPLEGVTREKWSKVSTEHRRRSALPDSISRPIRVDSS